MVNINVNMIQRAAEGFVRQYMAPGKVVVVYGPRRVGKTTLLRQISRSISSQEPQVWLEGELDSTKQDLSEISLAKFKRVIGKATLLIIDEAQAIPDIGRKLKVMVDQIPGLKIIASGSASFRLAHQVGEPLVGRQEIILIFPLWAQELRRHFGHTELTDMLPELLVYGSYPELFQLPSRAEKERYLNNLVSASLYRDILELDTVRSSGKIHALLQMLALQIGHEVSLHELATALEMGTNTVSRYLDLLEQAFVIKNIRGFSRNLRKEITRTSRYYFYDNGVRNQLISNFNPPDPKIRSDVGALWENWLVMERLKKQSYTGLHANNYFWRTYDQKEIDWIEEREGKLFGYEFSWQDKSIRPATARQFLSAYPGSQLATIHRDNYEEFIM